MALTHLWCDGFEYGPDYPSTTSGANAGIAGTITNPGASPGTTSVADGVYGSYALRCNMTSGGGAAVNRAVSGTPNKFQVFFRFKVETNPATNPQPIGGVNYTTNGGTNVPKLGLNTNGTIRLRPNGSSATGEQTGPNVNDGAWHTVELQLDTSANPWTIDWWVDNVKQTQATRAVAADTVTNCVVGAATAPTETVIVRYDDWIFGTWTSAADRYTDVKVVRLSPGSDGTHNTAGGATFIGGDTATTPNFTNSTTTVWQLLDDFPLALARSTTDNVSAETHVAGDYLEVKNTAASSGEPTALAVTAWMQYSSPATTANGGSAAVVRTSAGTDNEITGAGNFTTGADYSETSNFLKSVLVPNPSSWTKTELDAIRFRIGRASNSSDVSPRPTWQALLTQVAYPIPVAYTLDAQPGAFTVTGASSGGGYGRFISADPGSYAVTGAATGNLGYGRVLQANPGAFLVTGSATGALADRLINAEPGIFAITGVAMSGYRDYNLNAGPGSFAVSGADIGALVTYVLNAQPGSFAVTGAVAGLLADRVLSADPGAYVVTGADSTLDYAGNVLTHYVLDAQPGSFGVGGSDIGGGAAHMLNAEPGSFAVVGSPTRLIPPLHVIPSPHISGPVRKFIEENIGDLMAVRVARVELVSNSSGSASKRIRVDGSWLLAVKIDHDGSAAGCDVTVADADRTLLQITDSNADGYYPVREEVVGSDGVGLGLFEPSVLTGNLVASIAQAGANKSVFVTVFYQ